MAGERDLPLVPATLSDVFRMISDSLTLRAVVDYSQSDRSCFTSTGGRFDMASLNGLRDNDPQANHKSLTLISKAFGDNPLVVERVMAFLARCYVDEGTNHSDFSARALAMRLLGRAKACDSVPFVLEMLMSDEEVDLVVLEAAAEAIGCIGLPDESFDSIFEMLNDEMLDWTGLQIVLSLAKNTNLPRGHAEEVMRIVDRILHDACASVEESGPDNQYLIPDCAEVLVRAGALCGRDATGSLRHLHIWTTFVVDEDAVTMLSERVGEIRAHLSEEAARLLDGVLAPYMAVTDSESDEESELVGSSEEESDANE